MSLVHKSSQQLEQAVTDLFLDVTAKLSGRYLTVQLMTDDNFVRRRDRTENDIHAFFELDDSKYFHLRACVRHMLYHQNTVNQGNVFLTAYLKDSVSHTGGEHSLQQRWYSWNPEVIAEEIVDQNPALFGEKS